MQSYLTCGLQRHLQGEKDSRLVAPERAFPTSLSRVKGPSDFPISPSVSLKVARNRLSQRLAEQQIDEEATTPEIYPVRRPIASISFTADTTHSPCDFPRTSGPTTRALSGPEDLDADEDENDKG